MGSMNIKKTAKIIGKILLWILGIWMGLLLIIQIVMLPPILTPIVNSLANKYVNANVSVGRAYGSVITHFPRITLSIDDLEITYPHEKYDSLTRAGSQNALVYQGCGETMDTLASIKRLSASVNLLPLLWGEVKIPDIEIKSPTIYAHSYDAKHANWDIFGSGESSAPADTTTAPEPETSGEKSSGNDGMNIIFKRINITGKPKIVYTDNQDSLFVKVDVNSIGFNGNFETNALHKTMAKAHISDLRINGKFGSDTLAGKIPKATLTPHNGHMDMSLRAQISTKLENGRIGILPMRFNCDLSIPKDEGIAVSMNNIQTSIVSVPGEGDIEVKMRSDSTIVNGRIDIKDHNIEQLLNSYFMLYMPELFGVNTDTRVTVHTTINGAFNNITGTMPAIEASVSIPDSKIDHHTFPEEINLGMEADFQMDEYGQFYADITKSDINTYGLAFNSTVETHPLAEDDREIKIDGNMRVSLDSLRAFLPDTLNLVAKGGFNLELNGTTKMSDLGVYQFSKSELLGKLTSRNTTFIMPEDSIDININDLEIKMLPTYIPFSKNSNKKMRFMGIIGTIGSADIKCQDAFAFSGSRLNFYAMNSTEKARNEDKVKHLNGGINAKGVYLEDSNGTSIKLDETKNGFNMHPDETRPSTPVLTLENKNLRITYVTPDNRVILTDSKIELDASMNTFGMKARRTAWLDSLSKVYPDVPRDSLMHHVRSLKRAKSIPSWMQEDDFRSSDIRFDINENAKKYFREWTIKGNVGIRTGIVMTPQLPLRNIIRGISFSFNNDSASIDSLKINAGNSQLHARGHIGNLRKVMFGKDTLALGLEVKSESIDADELLNAYAIGSQYQSRSKEETKEELTNAEFLKQVTSDTVKSDRPSSSLVIIPGNINADIKIAMSNIKYRGNNEEEKIEDVLNISKLAGNIAIKERCAQITDATFESNVGNANLDAIYVVRSKKDIRTGFCLDLKNVTSERVISLMPEISSVMPMIESLKGNLDCEVAVTAELDTTMSLKMSTVNGIARLGGKNLTVTDDETYRAIAKTLLFRNKKKGEIKDLMVEGAIKDSRLEIFPFILAVDRYKLAVTGIQNADMSYKHHISVLRSPLLIRLGLNLSGPDYDNMKFKLGKALYKAKDMPSFTAKIDQTKHDLRHSIYDIFKKGVDKTIEDSNTLRLIDQHQVGIGYTNAALLEMEDLSEEEMKELEESESADALIEKTMTAAVAAVQKVLKNK